MQGRISVILVSRRVILSNFALKKNHKNNSFIIFQLVTLTMTSIKRNLLYVTRYLIQ